MRNLWALFAPFCLISCLSGKDVSFQALSPTVNYERDMVVTVNGVTRIGTITMPLLEHNEIHVQAQGDLDIFLMRTCGGIFKKQRSWNVEKEVSSGLFGWGSKKITLKNQVKFTIDASDFHEVGVCPLYLTGVSTSDGKHSEAYINWQTPEYQLSGSLVCNMEKRDFSGVEACAIASGSYVKLKFNEDVYVSPKSGCEIGKNVGREFEWRAKSGTCNYEFVGVNSDTKGMYSVYGWDDIIIR